MSSTGMTPGVPCWPSMPTTPVTRVDLFTVPPSAVPRAVARMATDRRRLRRADAAFWKLLGTGDGRTFDARDADLRRWGVLTVWPTAEDAAGFATRHDVVGGWGRLADEHWWALLHTLRVTGSWSRRRPFGAPDERRGAGPVAVLTRARLRWSRAPTFWRSVAAVTANLDRADGLRLRLGVGEAPLGLQGTFSLWDSPAAMQAFAYRGAPHRDVIRRSADERWYAEELFARFAVADHGGTVFGADPLAGIRE
jgi:hypothetical protein